jgi:hypothetical protein
MVARGSAPLSRGTPGIHAALPAHRCDWRGQGSGHTQSRCDELAHGAWLIGAEDSAQNGLPSAAVRMRIVPCVAWIILSWPYGRIGGQPTWEVAFLAERRMNATFRRTHSEARRTRSLARRCRYRPGGDHRTWLGRGCAGSANQCCWARSRPIEPHGALILQDRCGTDRRAHGTGNWADVRFRKLERSGSTGAHQHQHER